MRHQFIQQEIRHIQSQLWLQLPTNPAALSAQVRQIDRCQQQLERLQDQVLSHQRSMGDRSLMNLIDHLITDATSFKLLAEEYLIDPEGSVSCLHSTLHSSLQGYGNEPDEILLSRLPNS